MQWKDSEVETSLYKQRWTRRRERNRSGTHISHTPVPRWCWS